MVTEGYVLLFCVYELTIVVAAIIVELIIAVAATDHQGHFFGTASKNG